MASFNKLMRRPKVRNLLRIAGDIAGSPPNPHYSSARKALNEQCRVLGLPEFKLRR